MIIFLAVLIILAIAVVIFMNQKQFGKLPSGERLDKIKLSPHYKNGSFQNLSITPSLTEGTSYFKTIVEFLFNKKNGVKPKSIIPSIKTNLLQLNIQQDLLIWFGHSSYFIQIDGKRILVDPVFSGSASPLPGGTQAFKGSNIYTPENIPVIDFLFISHDHWDHLDYKTIVTLKPKIKKVICPLGVGSHLEYWGYNKNIIEEKDWNEKIILSEGFVVNTTPARHFSGRGFKRNNSLWMSFVLQTPSLKIFLGGDSGYDKHFAKIGNQFGPFDLAILENGQYNNKWRYIHCLPEEVIKAAKDLNAKKLLAIHSSKFALALHSWDEPLKLLKENSRKENLDIITPKIGEIVYLKETNQKFSSWWEGLD